MMKRMYSVWRKASQAESVAGGRGTIVRAVEAPGKSWQQGHDHVTRLSADAGYFRREREEVLRWNSSKRVSGVIGGEIYFPNPLGLQHLHSSADRDVSGVANGSLLHVLRCELDDLSKRSQNIVAKEAPKPFTLVRDDPGELEMTLTRIYGMEDISVSCVLQLVSKRYQRKAEIGEDPEARSKMLQLTISITKGGALPVLKLRCECYRDGFAIHQVDLEGDEGETAFRPYFCELKSEIVNNFQLFLYERGLNADLANYMEAHLENKRLLKSALVIESMIKFLD